MNKWITALALGSAAIGGAAAAQVTPAGAPQSNNGQGGGGQRGGWGRGGGMLSADANGDGVITRDEYLAQVDQRFERMDLNKDGLLQPQEMPARGGWRGRGQEGAAPPPLPAGGVTRDQYRQQALGRFDRMDTNHDGRIDQAEMQAMMARFRGGYGGGQGAAPAGDGQ